MMRSVSKDIFIFLIFIAVIPLSADDGMWLPHQMKDLNLKEHGLQMNPDDLYKTDGTGLMSAVVSLGGGTGEFVSKKGLILTNHHVAYRAIQRASDPQHNYLEDGFLAHNMAQEIPALGIYADVLLKYEEITNDIWARVKPEMTYTQKYEAIDRAQKQIIARKERAGKDIRCDIKSMYSGNQFYLFTYKRLRDIRIVYAPPRDIGNFGGEIDNWIWPRHTGDFTFLRAYVSPQNIGAEYDEQNVPYQPTSIMKISLDGVNEGDFTFVMGYPGKTYRNYTVSELVFELDKMKKRIGLLEDVIQFFEDAGRSDKAIEIKYAGNLRGFNNTFKNYQGKLQGIEDVGLVQRKEQAEQDIMNWVEQEHSRKSKYGTVLSEIDNFMKKYAAHYWKTEILNEFIDRRYGAMLLYQAHLIYRCVEEKQKPDLERETDFQDRNSDDLKNKIKLADKSYDVNVDKAYLKQQFKKYSKLPENQLPQILRNLYRTKNEQAIDEYVDDLYAHTNLTDSNKRLALIDKNLNDLTKVNDPLIHLAAQFEQGIKALRDEENVRDQERMERKKVYLAALLEQKNGHIAADANGSIRFTYGDVAGYTPRDAVYYRPVSTLTGVMEKETGEFPFHVPDKLKELYREKDFGRCADKTLNDVPTCFLNATNVTGGSSGSPTINAQGEQVGIIFDMTYESVIGDFYIIPELQRTISVDIRYVLFITEKFSGAKYLVNEMGL